MNPNAECKAVNVVMVDEAPTQEEKVETEIIPSHPPPKSKSSSEKPKPLSKFLEVFACLEVNMSLLKNLREMPAHVHSMKELLVKKKSLKKGDTVVMNKECSELDARKSLQFMTIRQVYRIK
ncbi:hypothetical protein PIB30_090913 [Stylosanthes scabra]|uniref:Uncharacterized protein n=1 Tax=Stylosanthes scabra TaxID=79078 RepID=A0ABU6XR32_9FABA|nr:hypothetical protein [Stylosanthes scabra]